MTLQLAISVLLLGGVVGAALYLGGRSLQYLWTNNSLGLFAVASLQSASMRQLITALGLVVVVLAALILANVGTAWAFITFYR